MEAPALLQNLLSSGARVRTAMKPFSAQTGNGLQSFQEGTLLIQAGIQDPEALPGTIEILTSAALSGLDVHSLKGTLTPTGPDSGSEHFPIVRPIRPLIIGGKGASSYDVGEQWFLFDQRLKMATPIVEWHRLDTVDLQEYTHLLLADGDFSVLRNGVVSNIIRWVRAGGVLLTSSRAAAWAESLCFEKEQADCPSAEAGEENGGTVSPKAYSEFTSDKAQQVYWRRHSLCHAGP